MIRGGILIAAVWLVGLLAAPAADAKTFKVTRLADTPPDGCNQNGCTLREAVIAANNNGGRDVIVVRAGKTYRLTIPGAPEEASLTGDLDVTGRLEIRSNGKQRAVIDSEGIDGVIDAFADLTVKRIEVTGGSDAGIDATDAGLVLRSSRVRGNPTWGVRTMGTAQSELTLIDSRSSGNGYQGIQKNSPGPIRLTDSAVSGNAHQGIQQSLGGGIVLVRSAVDGNGHQGIQQYQGGGVLLRQSSVSDNGNQGVQEYDGGKVTLARSQVSRNESQGIQTYDAGGLVIDRGSIRGNGSQGISVSDAGSAVIRKAKITGSGGNGVYRSTGGALRISNSLIARNTRGVTVESNVSASIKSSTIEGNEGDDGGAGVYLMPDSTLTMNGSTVSGNTSQGDTGGGIRVAGATLKATNSTVAGNESFLSGGGIFVSGAGGEVRLNAVTIARNTSAGSGGGIASSAGGSFPGLRNTLIANNNAPVSPDCAANIAPSGGRNLLTDDDGCTGLIGSDSEIGNPRIGALKKNGGPTKTVALKKGSPAIGKAGSSAPKRDQRGRKRDKNPDVGAYER